MADETLNSHTKSKVDPAKLVAQDIPVELEVKMLDEIAEKLKANGITCKVMMMSWEGGVTIPVPVGPNCKYIKATRGLEVMVGVDPTTPEATRKIATIDNTFSNLVKEQILSDLRTFNKIKVVA